MKIKQFEWEETQYGLGSCSYVAKIGKSKYTVQNFKITPVRYADEVYEEKYYYYFNDEFAGECNTLKQAKEKCVTHCEDYIKEYLEDE